MVLATTEPLEVPTVDAHYLGYRFTLVHTPSVSRCKALAFLGLGHEIASRVLKIHVTRSQLDHNASTTGNPMSIINMALLFLLLMAAPMSYCQCFW